jgi:site-specific DNA-methyltransferase (adenine-specific)
MSMANEIQYISDIKCMDGLKYLESIENNSIDLILTDPPYIISKDSGMNNLYNDLRENDGKKLKKTEEDWQNYRNSKLETEKEIFMKGKPEETNQLQLKKKTTKKKEKEEPPTEADWNKHIETQKENYLKYGTIYGTKYSVQTDYGEWDSKFTETKLELFIKEYYNKLKKGGTLIVFYDLWKITSLKEIMERQKFKQIRFIEWIKTNPQPLNSSVNYLTNCREIALMGVKGGSPTFNSKYDQGIYEESSSSSSSSEITNEIVDNEPDKTGEIYKFPIQGGKIRSHPTQKSLLLFEKLIEKHSNENDVVLDTFLGGGTTAIACKNKKRYFKGCEISQEYYSLIVEKLGL